MKVALLDPGGFTPDYDAALASALASAGGDVDLIAAPSPWFGWPRPEGYRLELAFARALAGAPAALARWRPLRRMLRALSFPGDWRRLDRRFQRRPPDVVHLQWSLAPRFERAWLARWRRRGSAIVVTVHNPRRRGGDRGPTAASVSLAASSDGALFLSRWAAAEAARTGDPPRRHAVIPHGLGPPPGYSRAEARARLGLPEEIPIVLLAGLLRPYKGIDLLAEAFREVARTLPAARLWLAGRPCPPWRPTARRLAAPELAERLLLETRTLTSEELELRLVASDVVVLPYREASQSGVGSLALACERAVVVARSGGLPELVGEEDATLAVTAGDAPELAGALIRLLGDREGADRIGRRLRSRALERGAGWREVAAAHVDFYGGCLAALRGESA